MNEKVKPIYKDCKALSADCDRLEKELRQKRELLMKRKAEVLEALGLHLKEKYFFDGFIETPLVECTIYGENFTLYVCDNRSCLHELNIYGYNRRVSNPWTPWYRDGLELNKRDIKFWNGVSLIEKFLAEHQN